MTETEKILFKALVFLCRELVARPPVLLYCPVPDWMQCLVNFSGDFEDSKDVEAVLHMVDTLLKEKDERNLRNRNAYLLNFH